MFLLFKIDYLIYKFFIYINFIKYILFVIKVLINFQSVSVLISRFIYFYSKLFILTICNQFIK